MAFAKGGGSVTQPASTQYWPLDKGKTLRRSSAIASPASGCRSRVPVRLAVRNQRNLVRDDVLQSRFAHNNQQSASHHREQQATLTEPRTCVHVFTRAAIRSMTTLLKSRDVQKLSGERSVFLLPDLLFRRPLTPSRRRSQ